jgi:hypothetical protein
VNKRRERLAAKKIFSYCQLVRQANNQQAQAADQQTEAAEKSVSL